MPIGLCPRCRKLYEESEEYVNEGFGSPYAQWCGPCYRRRNDPTERKES